MRFGRLFSVLLLATIFGLTVQLMCAETSALTLQQTATVTIMNDVPVLNATYPALFNPNYTYTEFASVDLATVPRPSGVFTFRDVTVGYSFVYDEHGIVWSLTQGQVNDEVLVLMAYSSSTAPSTHRLRLNYPSILVAVKSNTGFAHAYLLLMQPKQ